MKLRSFFAALLLVFGFLEGCQEKDNEPEPAVQPTAEPGMTAVVDGNPWKAINAIASSKSGFQFGGQNEAEVSITFYHAGISQPGVYHVTAMVHEPIPNTASVNSWVHPNAEITITKFDAAGKKISGMFAFVASPNPGATGTRTVTNGVFTDILLQ